ncbi:MAG: hypothetical protein DSY85_15675, partial [Marinomonas sp.]
MSDQSIWAVIILLGIGTYLIRYSFLGIIGGRDLPEWLLRHLRYVPFAVLPIFVTMEKIDRSLLEAANDLGDSPFWRFVRVTLPLSMPGVVAATLIVFVPTIGDYVTPKLVGGPNGLMIANMIELGQVEAGLVVAGET